MNSVTGEECTQLWQNVALRRYVINYALRKARNTADAEDFVQDAWFRLWRKCGADWQQECYEAEARKAIRASYMRLWRARRRNKLAREMRLR